VEGEKNENANNIQSHATQAPH